MVETANSDLIMLIELFEELKCSDGLNGGEGWTFRLWNLLTLFFLEIFSRLTKDFLSKTRDESSFWGESSLV